jgi:hypothetical protein
MRLQGTYREAKPHKCVVIATARNEAGSPIKCSHCDPETSGEAIPRIEL